MINPAGNTGPLHSVLFLWTNEWDEKNSYCVWPDLDHPVATWLVRWLTASSIRISIRVGEWMRKEQFSKGRKVVRGRQKQQLSTENKILLSFGRMTQSLPPPPKIWSSFGELKTESFWTIQLRTELSGNGKCPRTLIWMRLILFSYIFFHLSEWIL